MARSEAERALAAFVTEQPSARVPAPSRAFGELLERWFDAPVGDWSPSTAQQTRWVIKGNLKGLSDRQVASIGVEDLDRFYAALRERAGGAAVHWRAPGGPDAHHRPPRAAGRGVGLAG